MQSTGYIDSRFGAQMYEVKDGEPQIYVVKFEKKARPEIEFPFISQIRAADLSFTSHAPLNICNGLEYEFDEMREVEGALNDSKHELDEIYYRQGDEMNKMAKTVLNLYARLRHKVSREFGAPIVNNAWLKLCEIDSAFNVIAPRDDKFRAFCNAEFPGGMLIYVNHAMRTKYQQVEFDWCASSLIDPAKPNKLDDQYGLWRNNPDRWLMNDGNNGDITVAANLLDFERRLEHKIDLYVSDAGIDVGDDYDQQEDLNKYIDLGQLLCGLLVLAPGGNLVVKQYTFFRAYTISNIEICRRLFTSFHICKPATSNGANSEVYLVGLGFKSLPDDIRRIMFARLESDILLPMVPQDFVDGELLRALVAYAARLAHTQIAMQKNYKECADRFLDKQFILRKILGRLYEYVESEYLRRNQILPIDAADLLKSD